MRSSRSTRTPSRSPRARRRAEGRQGARAAPRDPRPHQGQRRDGRQDADDGGLARPRRRDPRGGRAHRQAPARRGRRDPRQDEPLGVGELPLDAFPERLERARRAVPQSLRARPGPVRLELRLGRRGGGEPLRGHGRHRDRRLDRVALQQLRARGLQADARPRVAHRHHPDRPLAGHGRTDDAHGGRRRRRC